MAALTAALDAYCNATQTGGNVLVCDLIMGGLVRRVSVSLLDASTVLASCCGFDLCHKYILSLYL